LSIDPIETAFRQAVTTLRQLGVHHGEQQLRALLAKAPRHIEARFLLGIVLARTGRWDEAQTHLSQIVAAQPNRDEALYWLAIAKKNLGDPTDAASLNEKALAINPRNPIVLNELGLCQMTMNQPERAAQAFQQAVRLDLANGIYYFNLGLALIRLDRIHKAREAFEESIRLEPNKVETYLELVRILEILDLRQDVVAILRKAVELHPAEFQLVTALAAATAYVGNRAEAEEIFRRAMSAHPVSGNAYGLWLQQEGRFEESVECFLTSIRSDPIQGVGYYGLSEAKVYEIDGERWREQAESALDSSELDLKGRTYLCYALAKTYERNRDVQKTIEYFNLANESAYKLYNEGRPFDRMEQRAQTDRTIKQYSAEVVNRRVEGASDSNCPIFIVGMIRSGTTLLDQVISSHPEVKSAGEPVFWMRESDRIRRLNDAELTSEQVQELAQNYLADIKLIAGESHYITDKMPLNYRHLGLMHQVFPNAKFIHLRRNSTATCFSIYTTFFGRGPNFAYNASNIAANYRDYLMLMKHWRAVLPSTAFIEIDYESVVVEREATLGKVLQFCSLSWSEACLHHERNECSIRTPSFWQARQPIYSNSIDRWKPYKALLDDFTGL
jgi:tetratricopeptide (TPR) repeat protein